ncbi:MAG: gluconate 2-dehydrogenase subunit 3 family protein [Longimicrobiales bacterium]
MARSPRSDAAQHGTAGFFTPRTRRAFRAIAESVVPEAALLPASEWAVVESIVEKALAARPESVRRQVKAFLRLLDVLAMARRGRRLHNLPPDARTRFLGGIQDSPFALLRRGFWGVRTLVFMGYYARPAAAAEIGYRAHALGWEARR